MKTVLLKAPGEILIAEAPEPKLSMDNLVIKVKSASICGADINSYLGKNNLVSYPRVIGHEIYGTIAQTTSTETEFSEGDTVVLEPYVSCGNCYPCRRTRTNCCESIEVLGVHRDGGMAEYIAHPRNLVHKISPQTPPELGCLVEPLSIALHSIHRLALQGGEHIAIYGAGTIGIVSAMVALHYQAIPILVDVLKERLDIAHSLGFEHVVNATEYNPLEYIAKLTSGSMAPCVLEASGAQAAIQASLDAAAYSGRIALTGYPKDIYPFDTAKATKKEIDVLGSRNSAREFPEAIRLVESGSINIGGIISRKVSFMELPDALAEQARHPELYLKIVGLF